MANLNQLGNHDQYTDAALVEVPGPDNTKFGYQYDQQTRAFFVREVTLLFSGKHGSTHITTDPIPTATCTTPGLLAAEDKCRLDNLVGTRIGVLGFQGAGFPDDGGFLQGDVILAAGSEMISLERVGNVIRFVVDVPAVFTCGNEDCLQMYWLQDETDVSAIRPPVTGGRLLGANIYGELKIYAFPENTIVNPANPSATLNNKGFYPTFIFKRYDDGTGTNEAELDVVLKRNASGTTIIGHAFTPGATGTPQYVVFMGLDDDGNRITFQLSGQSTTGVLGALMYNGVSITKRPAIITAYDSTVITSNIYHAKWWDTQRKLTLGTVFSITNQATWDLTTNVPVLDAGNDSLLSVGQIVDVYSIQIGLANGQPVFAHYCREHPLIQSSSLWTTLSAIEFGNTLVSHDGAIGAATVDDLRTYDRDWGIDGLHDVTLFNAGSPISINSAYDAVIDTSIPALTVVENAGAVGEQRRPVTIWSRHALRDAYLEIHFARPVPNASSASAIDYPPIDILVRAPIDSFEVKYATVTASGAIGSGTYVGKTYATLTGVVADFIPQRGLVRIVTAGGSYGNSFAYIAVLRNTDGTPTLVMNAAAPTGTVEILHEEYRSPAARLKFGFNNTHDISLQPQVGILDPTMHYSGSGGVADLAGAMMPGYAVGTTNWQNGATSSGTGATTSAPAGFIVYTGAKPGGTEVFNVLQVLVFDQQLWLWWNGLLMAPNSIDSGLLATPVDIATPYYPITDVVEYGKFGVRLFPGAKIRRFIVRSKPIKFSQYSLGQLEVG